MAQNKGLTDLNVTGCDLADAGFSALGQALRNNRTLTCLKLDANYVSLDGLKGFKGCLYGNKKVVVPYPVLEERILVGGLQAQIPTQQKLVANAKANIKIACRGGRVKPWLGNPSLKARSLEQLRAAKREEGRCTRLIKKIQVYLRLSCVMVRMEEWDECGGYFWCLCIHLCGETVGGVGGMGVGTSTGMGGCAKRMRMCMRVRMRVRIWMCV